MFVVGIAANPMLTSSADGTASPSPESAHALCAIYAALVTADDPHCSPMHCATAISHEDVSQRQESTRQRHPEQEQEFDREQDCEAQTD